MKTATTMKLSKRTLDILKNFSTISEHIYIPAGNKLYTIGKSNGVVAEAIIDETFDSSICIYELMSFLGVVSLFDSPEFEFDSKSVTIHGSNNGEVKFHFCAPQVIDKIVKNHGKYPKEGKKIFSFELSQKQIDELIRSASVLKINTIKISESSKGGVNVAVVDRNNVTANTYSIRIEDGDVSEDCNDAYIHISFLNLISGNYKIDVYDNNTTKWTHKDINLKYYIAKDAEKD